MVILSETLFLSLGTALPDAQQRLKESGLLLTLASWRCAVCYRAGSAVSEASGPAPVATLK